MRGINDDHIHANSRQRGNALLSISAGTNCRTNTQTALLVFGSQRVAASFFNIAKSHHAAQLEAVIDDQHFFDAVLIQLGFDFFQTGAFRHSDQTLFGRHDRSNCVAGIGHDTQVTTGNNTDQFAVINHRKTGKTQLAGLGQQVNGFHTGGDSDRIVHNRGFITLYFAYFSRLLLDGHVFVHDTNTAFLGHGNCQARFGDGVHGSGQQWNIDFNLAGQASLEGDVLGQYFGVTGDKEYIIKCEGFLTDTQHGGCSRTGKFKAQNYSLCTGFSQWPGAVQS